MALVLKQPTLNEYTLSTHGLQENLNYVIKHKNIKPAIKPNRRHIRAKHTRKHNTPNIHHPRI